MIIVSVYGILGSNIYTRNGSTNPQKSFVPPYEVASVKPKAVGLSRINENAELESHTQVFTYKRDKELYQVFNQPLNKICRGRLTPVLLASS